VSHEVIERARRGEWTVVLTPTKPTPRSWFPKDLNGVRILCLASGGGQQAPIFAAAGAKVTTIDNSPRQLEQDRLVADREGLDIETIEGDMAHLPFDDESFDLIFHPVSNIFVPEIRPVWSEAYRVLRSGGELLAGFMNPVQFIFDQHLAEHEGVLVVKYSLPYSDLTSLPEEVRRQYTDAGDPIEFGHTLTDQIGGQIDAGFAITGLFEDLDPEAALAEYIHTFIATKATKR
jgi:SAM-dependent methyltransferase